MYAGASHFDNTRQRELVLSRTKTRLAAIALIVAVPALATGCFGGDSAEDILKETFNNDQTVTSGIIDLSFDVNVEGSDGGDLTARLSGPFQGNADDPTEFPQLDLRAKVGGNISGDKLDFDAGVTTTPDEGFVSYQGQAYEVPSKVYQSFTDAYKQQAAAAEGADSGSSTGAVFDQLGVDPSSWITNLSDEGEVDVKGTATTHISGDADVDAIIADIGRLAEATPGLAGQGFDPSSLGVVSSAVQDASIDVYTGTDDRILRKLELKLAITPPIPAGGLSGVTVDLSLTFSNVNEDQTITAPDSAKPLSELLNKLGINLGPLENLGSIPGLGSGGTGGGSTLPGGTTPEDAQKLLDCVAAAGSDATAVNACFEQYQ